MLVSLIVPVHNAEKYLEKCLESLLVQTFSDFEILLVENNSTDNSPLIIDKYVKKHSKLIRRLNCAEKGAGAARNLGVEHAKGRYFWFIDADDYIAPDAVQKLFDLAEKDAVDFCMLDIEYVFPNSTKTKHLTALDSTDKTALKNLVRYGAGPYQFFIRRDFWSQNHLAFKPGIIHEDMELIPAFALFVKKFNSCHEPLYFYVQNENSVLHQQAWNGKPFDIFPALESLYTRFKSEKAVTKYHAELEYFFIWNLLVDSAEDFKRFKEGHPGFKRSRTTLKKYFPNWRKNPYLKQKPLSYRLRRRLAYHGIVI